MKTTFVEVIEASQTELHEIALRGTKPANLGRYAKALLAYLTCDLPSLESIAREADKDSPMGALVQLRWEIRRRDIQESSIQACLEQVTEGSEWNGELFFVAAMAYEVSRGFEKAKDYYMLASETLENLGAKKKAVKALMNFLAAESCLNPERKLINDFLFLHKKAKKLGQLGTAGVALVNVSREYQRIGAYHIALKFCNRGLALQKNEQGTLPFYLSIAHRCEILLHLGRDKEAMLDYQRAMISDFAEVRAALDVIDVIRKNKAEENLESRDDLLLTWQERLNENKGEKRQVLGFLENKIIHILSKGPITKFDLIDAMYGKDINISAAENRLNNLLSRVRKKRPQLILLENGHYRLSDDTFLERVI